jgi:iron complex outermembrane recepter protein
MSRHLRPAIVVAATLLLVASEAVAQTTPATSSDKEGVLNLEDFVVTAERISGYRATNSITATGIGMPIGETPLMINVVTKDLITDTRSDLLIDALRFVPGVQSSPTNESQPFVRGFQGTYSLRNGVFRRQNLTTWNVERIEVIQGSASIFYSNVRPGGVINYITSKPVLGQTSADVNATIGNQSYYRGQGAFNVALGNNAAVLLTVGRSNDDTFRKDYNETQEYIGLAALWNITPDHQVVLEVADEQTLREHSWSAYAAPLTNSRYFGNPAAIASGQSISTWMTANFPGMPFYDMFAPFAPAPGDPYGRVTPVWDNSFQSTIDRSVDFTYNGKLTDKLALSVVGNFAFENNQGINPTLGDVFADGTFRNVQADWFINIRDSYNLNTKLAYRFNLGGMKHTVMAGNDNQWVTQRYPLFNGNTNLRGPVNAIFDPRLPHLDARGQVATPVNSRNTVRKRVEFFGGNYIVDQMSAFEERLFILAGARYVDYNQTLEYIITKPGAVLPALPPKFIAKEWTPQFGGLFKIGKGASVFASYSESIEPQLAIDITAGRTVEPITGKGFDVGAKLETLGGALTGTLDYYEIERSNVAIRDAVKNNAAGIGGGDVVAYYLFGNAQKVRGAQMDINWQVSRNLQLIAQWNHFLQAENVAPQANPLMIGIPIFAQAKDVGSVWAKYQPLDGSWKGFILGGGLRYNSATRIGSDFNANPVPIPSFIVADLLLGYQARLFDRKVDFRLNVKNLFDKTYREGGGAFGSDRRIMLSASTRF